MLNFPLMVFTYMHNCLSHVWILQIFCPYIVLTWAQNLLFGLLNTNSICLLYVLIVYIAIYIVFNMFFYKMLINLNLIQTNVNTNQNNKFNQNLNKINLI